MTALEQDTTVDLQPVEVHIRPMLTPSLALNRFLDDLERRNYAARTVKRYSDTLGEFVDQLPDELDVSQIKLDEHLRPWFARWRTLKPGTKATNEAAFSSWFKWLYLEGKITRNPMDRAVRTRRPRPEDLDVVTVSAEDVQRMLFAADTWAEKLCLYVLAYLGPRRHATALLRISDYDRARGRIRFREKRGKTIWKPVPDDLDRLIEQAIAAGIYDKDPTERAETAKGGDGPGGWDEPRRSGANEAKAATANQCGSEGAAVIASVEARDSAGSGGSPSSAPVLDPDAYLIPPEGPLIRRGERDDRCIWRLVKRVADRAGVHAHVHALRAAFAVYYLTANPGDTKGLKELMGHTSPTTTEVYLRKYDNQRAMEPVRSLSWGVVPAESRGGAGSPQIAQKTFADSCGVGAGGFEPPLPEPRGAVRAGREPRGETYANLGARRGANAR